MYGPGWMAVEGPATAGELVFGAAGEPVSCLVSVDADVPGGGMISEVLFFLARSFSS